MRLLSAKIGAIKIIESVASVGSELFTSIESVKSNSGFSQTLKGKDTVGGGGEPRSGCKRLGIGGEGQP